MASKEKNEAGHPAPDVGIQWLASVWTTVLTGPPMAAVFHEPCMWLLLTLYLIILIGSLGPRSLASAFQGWLGP